MEFSGFDLVYSAVKASVIIVSKDLFTQETLECAAARLLIAWPTLSCRMSLKRDSAYDSPASSVYEGFFSLRTSGSRTLPELVGLPLSGEIIEYDGTVLEQLFGNRSSTWTDLFHPRILTIEAVLLADATVLKFTIQHAASDTLGLYNTASAFCEGLRGPVKPRAARPREGYRLREREKVNTSTKPTGQDLHTLQAQAWWRSCTKSPMFIPATLLRAWFTYWRTPTSQKLLYFPEAIFQRWRAIARDANASVSTFSLLASWIQMNFADHADSLNAIEKETFFIAVNVQKYLQNNQEPGAELWNPIALAVASPACRDRTDNAIRLIHGAVNIVKNIADVRNPTYMLDYDRMMATAPKRQGQSRGSMGGPSPTFLLTSWSHAPFSQLLSSDSGGSESGPRFVQPATEFVKSMPLPPGQIPRCGICWRGENGGYWLAANLHQSLWDRITNVSTGTPIQT